ncbi:MAG: hypothetical protein A2Z16_09435 [Chloroflexi bacterium RBG_16_54_18]|nr:MAG: hypothetical protein A2Z16_09435 [Chloroflexi bacterium RBG_16_54_18]
MNFLTPAAFGLGLLLPLIVVLYLLKLRRFERRVSSTYLWRRMVRDLEANAPWQRLQRNLLLFLQLLFLSTLIFALARPYIMSGEFSGQSAILIVDTSASMAATDVAPSRLENAKQQINHRVSSLAHDVPITFITAGIQARVLAASSLDRRQISQIIQNLHVEMGGSDIETALQLASAIAARQPLTVIDIYSDGGAAIPTNLAVNGQLRFVSIGSSGANQAITRLLLETSPGGEDTTAFIQVVNYSDEEVHRRLKVTMDGSPFHVMDISLAGQEEASLLVEAIPINAEIVEAQLLPASTTEDYLSIDDLAYSVSRQQVPVLVNLISPGNRFLESALSLLPGVQLTRTDPRSAGLLAGSDITVIDAALPLTTTLPAGNLFFIAPVNSTEYFSVTGVLEHPIPIPAADNLELMKYISMADVNILDGVEIPLPVYAEPIIISASEGTQKGRPLLFVGESGGRRLVVQAFSLQHSDFPLQVAFPLLIANLIQWLAPDQLYSIPAQSDPGGAVSINLPLGIFAPGVNQVVTVTRPDGQKIEQQARDGRVIYSDTSQTGIYTVKIGDSSAVKFAVNLFSAQESQIKPSKLAPATSVVNQGVSGFEQSSRQEWWRIFALLALALLTLEWLLYHRSSLAYLAGKISKAR